MRLTSTALVLFFAAALAGGQAVEQGVDARPGGVEAGLEGVALGLQRLDLLVQQGVGALEFFMAQQQAFHPLGDLVKVLDVGHGYHLSLLIVGLARRGGDYNASRWCSRCGSHAAVQREAGGPCSTGPA